jgi:hypothetical protein
MDRLDRILALVRTHVPDLELVPKAESPAMTALAWLVSPINRDFAEKYTTVVGSTVYLPSAPEHMPRDGLAATLAHELVHQLDQAEHGLRFYAEYMLFPLPVGRSRRAWWERRAYAVDPMLAFEQGEGPLKRRFDQLVEVFAGPGYGWMRAGRRSAAAWLEPVVEAVRSGALQAEEPYRSILVAWRGK